MADLTATNAVLMLRVPGVFSSPQQLQGFGADDIFGVEEIELNQTTMGVDGILSGGMVFKPTSQTITLQSDSPSIGIMDTWVQMHYQNQQSYPGSMQVRLKSLGIKFNLPRGFLAKYPPMPDVGTIVKARKYTINWQRVIPMPV